MNEIDSTNQESLGGKQKTRKKVSHAGVVDMPKLRIRKTGKKKRIARKG